MGSPLDGFAARWVRRSMGSPRCARQRLLLRFVKGLAQQECRRAIARIKRVFLPTIDVKHLLCPLPADRLDVATYVVRGIPSPPALDDVRHTVNDEMVLMITAHSKAHDLEHTCIADEYHMSGPDRLPARRARESSSVFGQAGSHSLLAESANPARRPTPHGRLFDSRVSCRARGGCRCKSVAGA